MVSAMWSMDVWNEQNTLLTSPPRLSGNSRTTSIGPSHSVTISWNHLLARESSIHGSAPSKKPLNNTHLINLHLVLYLRAMPESIQICPIFCIDTTAWYHQQMIFCSALSVLNQHHIHRNLRTFQSWVSNTDPIPSSGRYNFQIQKHTLQRDWLPAKAQPVEFQAQFSLCARFEWTQFPQADQLLPSLTSQSGKTKQCQVRSACKITATALLNS